jgi:hypothetical protein
MSVIPLIIYASELALAAIILFYVVELLPIPKKRLAIFRWFALHKIDTNEWRSVTPR